VKAIAGIGLAAAGACTAVVVTATLGVVAVASYIGGADTPTVVSAASCTTGGGTATQTTVSATTANIPAAYNHPDQVSVARTVVQVGQQMGVPPRGWIIAVATTMQEAGMHNPGDLGSRNDHDSLGAFQQRPSTGWGSPAEIMDVAHAARSFYTALLKVSGWQAMPLTRAAQAVQRSAYPGAYAKHESDATAVVDAITGDHTVRVVNAAGQCQKAGQVTAGGWTQPVPGAVVSAYGQRDGKLHAGVDLAAAKRTAIRSAADGVVVEAHCDASTARAWSCDRDGQVVNGGGVTPGCGWMVDVRHAGGVETRYCHMVVAPLVKVGDHVAAGQQIGWSGSSGHSSGPHLHFEVHTGLSESSRATGANSTNPVPWMQQHGAPLGKSTI
jgi:murein DD-endopeptidase MepM/ murein hydrolase activator NlpD